MRNHLEVAFHVCIEEKLLLPCLFHGHMVPIQKLFTLKSTHHGIYRNKYRHTVNGSNYIRLQYECWAKSQSPSLKYSLIYFNYDITVA